MKKKSVAYADEEICYLYSRIQLLSFLPTYLSTYLPTYRSTYLTTHRSGELWTQNLKSHLVRTQSLNVLLLKPGVGQCVAIHATLTARDFFFA